MKADIERLLATSVEIVTALYGVPCTQHDPNDHTFFADKENNVFIHLTPILSFDEPVECLIRVRTGYEHISEPTRQKVERAMSSLFGPRELPWVNVNRHVLKFTEAN